MDEYNYKYINKFIVADGTSKDISASVRQNGAGIYKVECYAYKHFVGNMLTNWGDSSASFSVSLEFEDSNSLNIPESIVNKGIDSIDIGASGAVSGGFEPYEYSATGLPDGITINATTGVISGIPSTLSEGGTATITVKDAVVSTKSIEIMYGQVRNLLDTDIDVVSIDNIQTPLIDNPVMLDSDVSSYFSPVLGSNKYVFYALSWDEDGTHIWYSTNFNASKSYSVYVMIQANEGYSFIGMSSITAKINGNDATPMEKEGGMLTIKYDFGMPVNNPAQYSISYESGGGSGSMPEATAYQERLFTLPDCTFIAPEHKQFKAWKTGDTEYEVGDKYVFTGDGVITAVWEPKKYTVTFNKGSGEGVVPGDVKTHDIDYTVPDDNYYYLGKTGYKQYGWKLGSESLDGTGAVTTITSNEDIALYPVWRPLVYKIYYTSCSGWGSLPPAGDKIYGKAYTVSTDYSLEKTDYTQVGWGFTESFDGTGGVTTITNNENVWLRPIWIITPAVKSINIFPIMPNIQKGTSEQFDVSIVVVGGASDAVTWSVQGGVSGTTYFPFCCKNNRLVVYSIV